MVAGSLQLKPVNALIGLPIAFPAKKKNVKYMPIDTFYLDKFPQKKLCKKCGTWFTPNSHFKHICQNCLNKIYHNKKKHSKRIKKKISARVREFNEFLQKLKQKKANKK